jgi:hypothetical protein
MITGTDVSSHQPGWTPAPSDSFVFIKASEGHTYVSPTLPDQLAAARTAGLVVGYYHFLWPGDPTLQAQWFERAIWPYAVPQDLLVCDWEATKGGTASEADKDAFIAEVRRLLPGYKIGLYVNRSMWSVSKKRAGDFLWLAAYIADPGVTDWTFWQYTDHGPNGEPLDQNVANFATVTEFRDWITPPEVDVAERIPFRNLGLTCSCVVESLPYVELDMLAKGIIKESIDIFQLGYRDDVGASAGTHARGGCVDVGQYSAKAIDVWRIWGWTMQDRSPFLDPNHGHGWPYCCPHLAPAAQDQEAAWDKKRNGLINNQLVVGRWPVLPWKQALEKEKARMTELAKDIANELVNELVREAPRIAKAFLSSDGIILSGKDEPNQTNEFQAPKTFIKGDHDLLVDIRAAIEKLAIKPTP